MRAASRRGQPFRRTRGAFHLGRGLHVPAHRASSAVLSGAYPFLSVPALDDGVLVGLDALSGEPFCFDPWTLYQRGLLTNPNVLLAGVIGQGKSALAKSLTARAIPAGRRVYVPGDPKGEWAPVAEAVGGVVVRLAPGGYVRLNPLDADPEDPAAGARRLRLLTAIAETVLGRPLAPREHGALDIALRTAVHGAWTRGLPATLPQVVDALVAPEPGASIDDGVDLAHGLRRLVRGDLAGLFDGPTTTVLDLEAPMVVLDLSALGADDDALALAMTCAAAWLEAALANGSGASRWIVYDEAWRLLACTPLLRRMQGQWKLSRAYGIANLLVLHRLSDLDAVGPVGSAARAIADGLLADCSTRIIYRQETDQLAGTAAALGLSDTERDLLPRLTRGVGLWKLPGRTYLVRHVLTEDERRVFDTDLAMRGARSSTLTEKGTRP